MIFPFLLQAQRKWDLKECIAYGLEHHKSISVYANDKLAAQAKAKEALAAYLPTVNVNGTIDDNLKVQQQVIPAGIFGPTDTKVAFTKKFNTTGSVQLDQTIFDQSLLTGLKANKYSKQQAELNIEQNEETIIYNISTAFYQIFVYKEQLAYLEANKKNYAEQLSISELQVKKGVATEVDLNKIKVNYNNNNSNITAAESNLILAGNQLKNAMGFPMGEQLPTQSIEIKNPEHLDYLNARDTAFRLTNRTDYRLSQLDATLLDIDEKRIRNGIFPKLSAYIRYGGTGFGDQIGQSFNTISPFSAVGVKLSIPLFDGFKRGAQTSQAKYKRLNALQNLKIDEDKYLLESIDAKTKLVKAATNMENDKRNIELAQSVFKSTDLQYQKGVTDLTEWLNSVNSLRESQDNYLNSLYTYFQARIDLEKANGTIKTFYNSLQ